MYLFKYIQPERNHSHTEILYTDVSRPFMFKQSF